MLKPIVIEIKSTDQTKNSNTIKLTQEDLRGLQGIIKRQLELELWKQRALKAEAKLDKIRALVDKHFGGVG